MRPVRVSTGMFLPSGTPCMPALSLQAAQLLDALVCSRMLRWNPVTVCGLEVAAAGTAAELDLASQSAPEPQVAHVVLAIVRVTIWAKGYQNVAHVRCICKQGGSQRPHQHVC